MADDTGITLLKQLKARCKDVICLSLARAGRHFPKRSTPILTYHSLDESGSWISKSPDRFRGEMEFLKRAGYRTIHLSEALRSMREGRGAAEKRFVLTFDDGFRNVYDKAAPIMQEFGFTSTIFLVTDHVGKESCWEVAPNIRHYGADRLPLMSWDHAKEMQRAGHAFGSHTATHARLPQLDTRQLHDELKRSKSAVEEQLEVDCDTFCYPYGDYNTEARNAVEVAGFAGAVTIDFGLYKKGADPYELRRVGSARFTSQPVMEACIYGTYGWHRRRVRR